MTKLFDLLFWLRVTLRLDRLHLDGGARWEDGASGPAGGIQW